KPLHQLTFATLCIAICSREIFNSCIVLCEKTSTALQWSLERSRDIVNMPHARHFSGRRTKKNLSYPLTNVMHTMYLVTLYGDAARGRYQDRKSTRLNSS